MGTFKLDERLQHECVKLTTYNDILVLLMNNSLVPWIVLVPKVHVTELHDLDATTRRALNDLQDLVARFLQQTFLVDKLNIAAIGNVVSQMHIHVIGRRTDDFCWPNVVWGRSEKKPWSPAQTRDIAARLVVYLEQPNTGIAAPIGEN